MKFNSEEFPDSFRNIVWWKRDTEGKPKHNKIELILKSSIKWEKRI